MPYPRIVHGMLLSSMFPTLLSTIFPGAIYRSQKLKWHSPLPCDDHVLCRVDITKILQLKKKPQMLLTLDTLIIRATDGQVVVSGEGELYLKTGGVVMGDWVREGEMGDGDDDVR
jgi:acyl dehydratase